MKAIVVREFGGPQVMKLENMPEPSPGPNQVLIRVKAVGVNPVDTYIRSGTYARKPSLPYIPGADLAGIVEAVGSGVTRFAPGQRVYAYAVDGASAEFAVCDQAYAVPYGTPIAAPCANESRFGSGCTWDSSQTASSPYPPDPAAVPCV